MAIITIEVDDAIVIPLGKGRFGTLTIDPTRLPMNALQYLWYYGCKKGINDAIAEKHDKNGDDMTPEAVAAKAAAKLQALYDGTIRVRGESLAVDEYEVEAIRMAKRHIIKSLSKAGLMTGIPKGTEDRMMFAINKHLRKLGKSETDEGAYLKMFFGTPVGMVIVKQAREAVDARRALGNDLDDLLPGTDA